ncbi:hypothetical protein DP113_07420 [Brasilonema octagenarum UFV-E1]|uniref:Uncharacterized protein n=2 Tax=Brasilonema TaxID=383614 RepID=A0A856MFB4_9CYAN|nr:MULTISPECIES: hypothetical protein [Brasilonema]NMF64215.1 hypothetical protein [Brasilonema octagenarum UFV-OR1]QDL07757.1 hypothetical protein DP114_07465 [Brasilonema sennae CENA114]QDL14119.1 hypothetical protein DP113_07420 [Brasilonema octagenarum UFV-E1]
MTNTNRASIKIGGGVNGSKVEGGKIRTEKSTSSTENNVDIIIDKDVTNSAEIIGGEIHVSSDLKAEIQELLNELAKNPITRKEAVAIEVIKEHINDNPSLKQRLLSALKAGGTEALKAIFNHPVVSVSVETVKGFLEAS